MAAGLALGSGLARGFANVLLSKRQQDQEKAQRDEAAQQQVKMTLLTEGLNRGEDPNVLIPALNLDWHHGEKPVKGQPDLNQHFADLLNASRPKLQPAGAQGSGAAGDVSAVSEGILPSSQAVSPDTPPPTASTGALGLPWLTPEQRLQQEVTRMNAMESAKTASGVTSRMALADAAKRALPHLQELDPSISLRDAMEFMENRAMPQKVGTEGPIVKGVAASAIPDNAVDKQGNAIDKTKTPYWDLIRGADGKDFYTPGAPPPGADKLSTAGLPSPLRERTEELLAHDPKLSLDAAKSQAFDAINKERTLLQSEQASGREANIALKNHLLGADLPTDNIPLTATGNDVLTALKPADAAEVKQLAEYRLPVSTRSLSANNPRMDRIRQLVEQYSGGEWSAANYDVRKAAMTKFTSGPQGDVVRKLNTTLGHLGTFADKALALNNGDIQLWNAAANKGKSSVGDPKVDGVLAAVEPVASDLVQLLRSSGGSEKDIQAWRDRLTVAKSPSQYAEVLSTMSEVIRTQQEGLQHQWQTSMGATPFNMLSAGAEKALAQTDMVVRKLQAASGSTKPARVNPFR